MSDEESLESEEETLSWPDTTDSESGDEIVAQGHVHAYQDEPLAMPGENELRAQEEDADGLSAATLDARLEGTIPLNEWCTCGGQCQTDTLENAREYRCCREVRPEVHRLHHDGSIETTPCITQHQDFMDLTKRVVLENVGPLLRDKQGRRYRKRAGEADNVYLRAVAYRFLVRWMCGYLGWEHARPLSACVYHKLRNDFPSAQTRGYSSSQERQ